MNCRNCQNFLPDDAIFCNMCGADVVVASIPEGYTLDPASGLCYQTVPGTDPTTGQPGNWVTWLNAATGEYTQNFYPTAQMEQIEQIEIKTVQQPVAPQQPTAPQQPVAPQQPAAPQPAFEIPSAPPQEVGLQPPIYQPDVSPRRKSPLMFVIPAASLLIGAGLAFLIYGGDKTPSDTNIPETVAVVTDEIQANDPDGGFSEVDASQTTMFADTDSYLGDSEKQQDDLISSQGNMDMSTESDTLHNYEEGEADGVDQLAVLTWLAEELQRATSQQLPITVFVRDYAMVISYKYDHMITPREAEMRHIEQVESADIYTEILEAMFGEGITNPVIIAEYLNSNGDFVYSKIYTLEGSR